MAKKAKIGDILEIPTKKGLAYVQYSHEHKEPSPRMGSLIRVLPGFFSDRPKEFQAIADQQELYYTLFPVRAAVHRGIFQVARHAAIPEHAKAFPLFRNGQINQETGKYYDNWWLWNGEKSWYVGQITDQQLDLSFRTAWNDIALIERIEQGWTPRQAEAFIQAARKKAQEEMPASEKGYTHFLLYDDKTAAENAKRLAKRAGFDSNIIDGAPGVKIKLVVHQRPPLRNQVSVTSLKLIAGKDWWDIRRLGGCPVGFRGQHLRAVLVVHQRDAHEPIRRKEGRSAERLRHRT